jgi:hypothetical protein
VGGQRPGPGAETWIHGLFLLTAISNPFFDIAGITAGTLHSPIQKYWLAVALGKSLVYVTLAKFGSGLGAS